LNFFIFFGYIVGKGSLFFEDTNKDKVTFTRKAETYPLSAEKRKLLQSKDLACAFVKQQEYRKQRQAMDNDIILASLASNQNTLMAWTRKGK
jgi:hypothetical protein